MRELMRRPRDRHGDQDRGASALEFALIAPVLFLLIFGIVDFGLGIWTYNNLSQAVREGARYAVVRGDGSTIGEVGPVDLNGDGIDDPVQEGPATCDGAVGPVSSVVCRFAFPLDRSKLTVTVQWHCGINDDPNYCDNRSNLTGELVKVTATYVYNPFVIQLIPVTMTLRSTSRMYIACCN